MLFRHQVSPTWPPLSLDLAFGVSTRLSWMVFVFLQAYSKAESKLSAPLKQEDDKLFRSNHEIYIATQFINPGQL